MKHTSQPSTTSRPLRSLRAGVVMATAIALTGCAIGPNYQRPSHDGLALSGQWQAPPPLLPHEGKQAALVDWWKSWNDPVLTALIDHTQRQSPTIAQASARIAQSRASFDARMSYLLPSFTGNAYDQRSKGGQQAIFSPSGNSEEQRSRHASLDAAWEIDMFGGGRRAREASRLRNEARVGDWHEARISLAAEVATQYVNLRTCELLLTGYEIDASSRATTARLTALKRDAGLESTANAALVSAAANEATSRLTEQRATCDVLVKVLTELTALPEPRLREQLKSGTAVIPRPNGFVVTGVPAELLSQRPDLASAERDLAAAMADIGVAMADRLPRLRLSGSIGFLSYSSPSISSRGREWSWGPGLSLPIFDAGQRAAEVRSSRARFDESMASYRGKVLRAVREVEEALVRLNSAELREIEATKAVREYERVLKAAEARLKVGAGNLSELEEARRALVAANGAAVAVTRERLAAWIALYKAVGGGWRADQIVTN